MRERYDNEVFFATPDAPRGEPSVAESLFYAGRPRPPPETPVTIRAAATPLRYALVIFLVGWAGILFQAQFLQQVVFGAPVFEELAKFGPPLLAVTLLRLRTLWVGLPLAWLSGAAFGVMEHYVTYPTEPLSIYVERVLFHAVATGLSMLFYAAFASVPDVRARWASTIPATLFHWANNFGAVMLGLGSLVVAIPDEAAGLAMSTLITGGMIALTLLAILAREPFERKSRELLATAMPRLGLQPMAAQARPE